MLPDLTERYFRADIMQYFLFNIGIPGLNNRRTEIFKIT